MHAGLLSLALVAGASHGGVTINDEGESRALAALAPAATRQGPTLQLRAANGRVVRFINDPDGDGSHGTYFGNSLTGITRDGKFFVVHSGGNGADTKFWVSRATGQRVQVHVTPSVSPDGRFAVAALERMAFSPSGLLIWEIKGDELLPPSHLKHGDEGLFALRRWLSNDTAELVLYSHSFLNHCRAGAKATTAKVRLIRVGTGWTLTYPTSAQDVNCV